MVRRPRPGTPAVLVGFANQNQTAGVAEGSAGTRECDGALLGALLWRGLSLKGTVPDEMRSPKGTDPDECVKGGDLSPSREV